MFTEHALRTRLPIGGLGLPLHFFESVGSTNDVALDLARSGAPHGALVVADAQTRGRGRGERRWVSPAGTSLAFSLLLRPRLGAVKGAWGLGVASALAVVEAIEMEGATVTARPGSPSRPATSGDREGGITDASGPQYR